MHRLLGYHQIPRSSFTLTKKCLGSILSTIWATYGSTSKLYTKPDKTFDITKYLKDEGMLVQIQKQVLK